MYGSINDEALTTCKYTIIKFGGKENQVHCTGRLGFNLVDNSRILTIKVTPEVILFPEADRMLFSPQNTTKIYPVNSKIIVSCHANIHHIICILTYSNNIKFKITVPINNTQYNILVLTIPPKLQSL